MGLGAKIAVWCSSDSVNMHLLFAFPDKKQICFCHDCWVLAATVWCLLIGFPLKSFSGLIVIGEAECFREKMEQLNHIKDLIKN